MVTNGGLTRNFTRAELVELKRLGADVRRSGDSFIVNAPQDVYDKMIAQIHNKAKRRRARRQAERDRRKQRAKG